jgi:hypothetical protein
VRSKFEAFLAYFPLRIYRFPPSDSTPPRAQFAQQYMRPDASTPWPTMRHPQWVQEGASLWMAHSKLSKVKVPLEARTSKLLS